MDGDDENDTSKILEVLDRTLTLFERRFRVVGFVPTPVDVANVGRLRETAAANGAEARAERLHLARELAARLPPAPNFEMKEREEVPRLLYLNR